MFYLLGKFLSTLPARGATSNPPQMPNSQPNFYPRSPRGERRADHPQRGVHAHHFYPRSPRGERLSTTTGILTPQNFYPRSPRGERHGRTDRSTRRRDFYPRSPRGERLGRVPADLPHHRISIHAPREGSDSPGPAAPSWKTAFLSTLPARGATDTSSICSQSTGNFYPRSPRGERPGGVQVCGGSLPDFYPRSPRGERPPPVSMTMSRG